MAASTPTSGSKPRKLWEHANPCSTPMHRFYQTMASKYVLPPHDATTAFRALHAFAVAPSTRLVFWADLFTTADYIYGGSYSRVVDKHATVAHVPKWFEGVELNFAENMLFSKRRGGNSTAIGDSDMGEVKRDEAVAVTEIREGGRQRRHVTWGELRREAARLARAMKESMGVGRGDRVVVVGSNSAETLLVWLATSWLGAIFTASSTDMGVTGILQRTVQVDPKLLFTDDRVVYNGREFDMMAKMGEVEQVLRRECASFKSVVVIPRYDGRKPEHMPPQGFTHLEHLLRTVPSDAPPLPFIRVGFNDPFLICYSSGTTGIPKAIVHSVGGLLLNYFKEGVLHEGMGPDTVSLQYTTVGWIMYIANVGPLLFGGRAILYDGSPFQPDAGLLIRIAAAERATKLGISPRWLLELARAKILPRKTADLSSLSVVTCTGMPLSDKLFAWFYDQGFPAHVQLANISGGTDIAGCFGCCNPLEPVYMGGCQGPSLGVAVELFDAHLPEGAPGRPVPEGEPGELVATQPFPNIPRMFWNDSPPSPVAAPGSRYHSSYFARYAGGIWAHGDFCRVDPVTRHLHMLGRADGVLNPSGVRFGSADIYSVLEQRFADRVADSLCVGQRREADSDESVMLFLLMREGCRFDEALVDEVKSAIAADLSKRHVPRYVFETKEIPTTVNLKKVELPVKQIVSGRKIKVSGTLANPQSLEYYYKFARVEEVLAEAKAPKIKKAKL